MSRNVRYSVAASLDGFIAGPDGSYDWIPEEPAVDFQAFLDRIDAILMGRKSYDVARQAPGGLAAFGADVYVASRTLAQDDVPDATLVADDIAGFVRDLKDRDGRDIWLFGGAALFGSLLEEGLVDTVEVAIVPVLLGEGIPLNPVPGRVKLSLERTETFPSGIVLNRYRVVER